MFKALIVLLLIIIPSCGNSGNYVVQSDFCYEYLEGFEEIGNKIISDLDYNKISRNSQHNIDILRAKKSKCTFKR